MRYEIQETNIDGNKQVHVYIFTHDKDALFHAVYHGTHIIERETNFNGHYIEIWNENEYLGAIYRINKKKIKWEIKWVKKE